MHQIQKQTSYSYRIYTVSGKSRCYCLREEKRRAPKTSMQTDSANYHCAFSCMHAKKEERAEKIHACMHKQGIPFIENVPSNCCFPKHWTTIFQLQKGKRKIKTYKHDDLEPFSK